jgi:hypothetical protein
MICRLVTFIAAWRTSRSAKLGRSLFNITKLKYMGDSVEYLCSANALLVMIELFIILRLSAKCRRLNMENDLLVRTIELQTKVVETVSNAIGRKEIDTTKN